MTEKLAITIQILDAGAGRTLTIYGRDAWALRQLIAAGPQGCTPIDQPAPRWSAYIFNLRHQGIAIETVRERHTGPFPGHHARYVLKSKISLQDAA